MVQKFIQFTMHLTSLRIITADIRPLVAFYEQVTGIAANWYTGQFAEVVTPMATLAIGSMETMALFGEGLITPGSNRSVIIEFRVPDVDAAYEKVKATTAEVVQTPTTMPWGNRSLLFRDPDGNLVNFFTPITPEARQKFGL
jgi:predicted enzyme related to lactoylglutathione lyase